MERQQGEAPRTTARCGGKFAAGYRQTTTDFVENRHWITEEGRAALAAAEAADLDRVRVALAGERR